MMVTLIKEKPLSHYLRHPYALREVDKAELKSLSSSFPYNPHLHILIALKDHLEHGRVNRELLEKAALYISDQRKLGEWVKKLQKFAGNWEPESDVFSETKATIETSAEPVEEHEYWPEDPTEEAEVEDVPAVSQEAFKPKLTLVQSNVPRENEVEEPEINIVASAEPISEDHTEDVENIIGITEELIKEHDLDELEEKNRIEEEETVISVLEKDTILEEEDILPEVIPETEVELNELREDQDVEEKTTRLDKPRQKKIKKEGDLFQRLVKDFEEKKEGDGDDGDEVEEVSPFLKWLQGLGNTPSEGYHDLEVEMKNLSLSDKTRKKKKKHKKKKKKEDPKLFESSLREDEGILSEALADLLASQGHVERAIEMYAKLRLIIPEKSLFFAQKISDLKNKSK
jgi:hypothetical protein